MKNCRCPNCGEKSISVINRIFTSYINYETVINYVFYELVDAQLHLHIRWAAEQGDISTVNYFTDLLYDEDYHWDTIKSQYPDTYNFLNSLRDFRANMFNY